MCELVRMKEISIRNKVEKPGALLCLINPSFPSNWIILNESKIISTDLGSGTENVHV